VKDRQIISPDHAKWRSLSAALAVALVIASALLTGSCGGGGASASNTTASTTLKPGNAKIVSFDVPATADCHGSTSVPVHVQYATSGGKSTELDVDGRIVPGATAASGALDVPVHCDPLAHTFVLIVKDQNGHPTSLQKILTTNL
jgi:hypothetical protein